MWESQVLLTDGQVVFPRGLRFTCTFDEWSAWYKWNILERAVIPPPPPPPPKKKKKKKNIYIYWFPFNKFWRDALVSSEGICRAGLGGSFGCAVRLETRRSQVQPPPRLAAFFRGDWSWNIFNGHSLPSADSRRAVVRFWRKNVHCTG